jgi:hypothetical protein
MKELNIALEKIFESIILCCCVPSEYFIDNKIWIDNDFT